MLEAVEIKDTEVFSGQIAGIRHTGESNLAGQFSQLQPMVDARSI